MPPRLFVYGSLAPGQPNAHVLAGVEGTWEPGTVRGTLVHEGWGAAGGFPGLILDERGDDVEGLLLTSDGLAAQWARLDAFEGADYERQLTLVALRDGQTVEAYFYALARGSKLGHMTGVVSRDR